MKLAPIKYNTITHKNSNYNRINNTAFKTTAQNISFGSSEETLSKINSDINAISNSYKFKTKMSLLRRKSLNDRVSYDDFIVASMFAYNEHAVNFPIKEDFFEYKIKARFIEAVKKYLNLEIQKELNDFLKANYSWGFFTDKKYGGSESFAIAIPCVLPYIKGYEAEISVLKLKDLEKKEAGLRKDIDKQDKVITAKEQLSNEYLKPVQAVQKDSTLNLPNSIMLECKDKAIANEIMQWTLLNTSARPIAIGTSSYDSNSAVRNKLKSALENARETYENYRTPTLIYCENFDKLLQNSNPKSELAAIKALLSNTYEKYHATIIFTTANSNTIENVLKQPHRMKQIKVE